MKKYLSALALVGLLGSASIAYGIEQPVIDQIKQPVSATATQEINQLADAEKTVTRAEFIDMLAKTTGYTIDDEDIIDGDLSVNEPIVLAEALDMCSMVVNPFTNEEIETADLAQQLNLIDPNTEFKDDAILTSQDVKRMINNLLSLINLKQNEKNTQGVSYELTPLAGGYKLELMWGKKPSSGYNIEIMDIKSISDTLYVKYATSEPKPGAAYLTVITYPADSVVMEVNKLPKKVVMINSN